MAEAPKVAYFAYGSNMDGSTLRVRRSIDWSRATAACAKGWQLVIRKPSLLGGAAGAMANIIADAASEVWGVLYEITADDLEHLELTEGVKIGHYERTEVVVEPVERWDEDGAATVRAVTLTSGTEDPSLRPTARYMELLLSGAAEHGLPESWIETLRRFETAEIATEAELRSLFDHAMKKPA
ncbi:MAG TPA: gamma-glutamylcyclotransferase family protein [Candidatus Limnocylindrales bacterium]|nr:gamma-glutamylcyclotransferase family protein [Candidatus Limnocylindrales bacterium]